MEEGRSALKIVTDKPLGKPRRRWKDYIRNGFLRNIDHSSNIEIRTHDVYLMLNIPLGLTTSSKVTGLIPGTSSSF
jgi:hypothetical protein